MITASSHNNAPPSVQTINDAISAINPDLPELTEHVVPPSLDGISLLDIKNELLLAYIQELMFLITLRLRENLADTHHDVSFLANDATRRLTALRVYIDRGVRPIEGRLRYQIDKVIRTAHDDRRQQFRLTKKTKSPILGPDLGVSQSISSDSNRRNEFQPESTSEASAASTPELDDLAYRPNLASIHQKPTILKKSNQQADLGGQKSAAYKPPRIQSVRMSEPGGRTEREHRGPRKSALMDEFVVSELSTAPLAEPSVGSGNTILSRGRNTMGRRERSDEKERREYEEANFVRLPGEGKAERRKRNQKEQSRGNSNAYGGEDWSGLGGLSDRIARVTGGLEKSSNMLERSRKRNAVSSEYDSQAGPGVGDVFDKRRKVLEGRKVRRKGGDH